MQWHKISERTFIVNQIEQEKKLLVQTLPFRTFEIPESTSSKDIKKWVKSQSSNTNGLFKRFFALDVITTTMCNFRCKYCYALSSRTNGFYGLKPLHMESEVIDKTLALSMNLFTKEIEEGGEDNARFDLFITGGEPLLNFKHVVELLEKCREYLKQLSLRYNTKIEFFPEIATNASLMTKEMAKILLEYDAQIAVTVDGPKHDERRPFQNGQGSLSQVLKSLDILINTGNKVKLQSIVPVGDTQFLLELFSFYQSNGLIGPIKRVHVIPQATPIHDLYYNKHLPSIDNKKYQEYSDTLQRLSKDLNLDIKNYQGRLLRSIKVGGLSHRCPAGQWKLAITPDGDLYPCHQLINIPEFYMGNIKLPFEKVNRSIKKVADIFSKRTVFRVKPCDDCIFQTTCIPFVDCPARCFLETSNLYVVPDHYCKIHRPYMEEILADFLNQTTNS